LFVVVLCESVYRPWAISGFGCEGRGRDGPARFEALILNLSRNCEGAEAAETADAAKLFPMAVSGDAHGRLDKCAPPRHEQRYAARTIGAKPQAASTDD
jgi:hypothetical protein